MPLPGTDSQCFIFARDLFLYLIICNMHVKEILAAFYPDYRKNKMLANKKTVYSNFQLIKVEKFMCVLKLNLFAILKTSLGIWTYMYGTKEL